MGNLKLMLHKNFSLALTLFSFLSVTNAQPVRDRILEEVTITHENGHHIIEINFPFRIRYQSHFPDRHGKELRIRLQPVRVAATDIDAVFRRESVVPQYASVIALDEVTYEGDIKSGTQLTLTFTEDVTYEVRPAPDYTHIRIIILSIN
jgi:hypothetical protein